MNKLCLLKRKLIKWFFKSDIFVYNSIKEYEQIKEERATVRYSFWWWVVKTIKYIILAILLFIGILLFGCSRQTVQYQLVNVPVKCDVTIPPKPVYTGDVLSDNAKILEYSEKLKASLQRCK